MICWRKSWKILHSDQYICLRYAFFLFLDPNFYCLNMLWSCGINTSVVVGDNRNIIKCSVTSPIFVSLSCGHGTNDTNSSGGRLYWVAYKGCSHITTNLGPHRAQTQWVWCIHSLYSTYKAYIVVVLLSLTNPEPFRSNAQDI